LRKLPGAQFWQNPEANPLVLLVRFIPTHHPCRSESIDSIYLGLDCQGNRLSGCDIGKVRINNIPNSKNDLSLSNQTLHLSISQCGNDHRVLADRYGRTAHAAGNLGFPRNATQSE
jgi:hypothetical protein